MFAVLMTLTIDPGQAPAAATAFTERLLPQVCAARGFVRGYWVDPVDGRGFGFVLFETQELAASAMPPNADWSAPGVVVERVDIRRVAVAV
jgi:hypothetical protein